MTDRPEPMHRWRTHGEQFIAGDSWGGEHDQLVVFLHGAGQTRHAWGRAGRVFAEAGYHAVALDARGHGDSSWSPDGSYEVDDMIADLVAVLRAIDKQRPVLVGASMGGGVVLSAVGEGAVEAAAVVLVDTVPRTNAYGGDRVRSFMRQGGPDGFHSLEAVATSISSYQPHRRRPATLDGLLKNVRLGPDGRYRWHWDPMFLDRPRDRDARTRRLESALVRLDVPSLLVHGSLSEVVTDAGVEALLSLSPRTSCVKVEGAAHMVAGDSNDPFIDAVMEFLATHSL
jgi:non-heme chloroperoxidase